jgi:cytoskeleton protein RodZ
MPSIGDTLREQRVRRGLTLDEVSERTRINSRLLKAMEAEEWDKLPGRFFARAFLRQYAAYLGVDPGLVSAELACWEEPVEAEPEPGPEPESKRITLAPIMLDGGARRRALKRWLGSLAVFALAVAVCAGLYAVWQRTHLEPTPAAKPAPPVVAPSTSPTAPPAAPPSAAPPAGPVAPISLEVRATEEVWIRVTSDGKVVFTGTLQPGQSRAFQGQESMNVLTGNAGGLDAVFNGKPLGPLGPRGQIRVLELTPAEHRILERKPPEPGPAPDEAARGGGAA